jgi:hypothetical protein
MQLHRDLYVFGCCAGMLTAKVQSPSLSLPAAAMLRLLWTGSSCSLVGSTTATYWLSPVWQMLLEFRWVAFSLRTVVLRQERAGFVSAHISCYNACGWLT